MPSNSRGGARALAALLLYPSATFVHAGFSQHVSRQPLLPPQWPEQGAAVLTPCWQEPADALLLSRFFSVRRRGICMPLSAIKPNGRGFGRKGFVHGTIGGKSKGKRLRGGKKKKKQDLRNRREREAWLQRATANLLDADTYPPGSLTFGKLHEVNSMISAWSKLIEEKDDGSSSIPATTAPLVIEGLLKRIIDERRAGNTEARTTTALYNLAINAWAENSGSSSGSGAAAARRAYEIVRYMQAVYEAEADEDFKPDSQSFLAALGAWTKASSLDKDDAAAAAAGNAREMLEWMEEIHESGQNDEAMPGISAYSLVLDAYANSGDRDAGIKAEELIRHMRASGKVNPNAKCYNIIIKAWTRAGRNRGSAENAERVLDEMEQFYEKSGDESVRPDVVSFTSVINAWANSGTHGQGAERAEEILNKMEEMAVAGNGTARPNTVTYNAVLSAWCKSGDSRAAARTEALLRRMEEHRQAGNAHVKPDLISFNTLLHVLSTKAGEARPGEVGTAHRAEEILKRMEQLHESGQIDRSPNLFSYNVVIEAWSTSRDAGAAKRAYAVLRRLVQRDGLSADSFSYNNVIFALSKSSLPGAALRAEELLTHMEKAYKAGNKSAKPDVFGYSSAINAWSRSGEKGSARRAEELLARMEDMYLAGDKNLKPNTITYNSVIDAWAKSGEGTLGARRAEFLLEKMEALYEAGDKTVQPNSVTYNAVLNAWARSGTRCCARKAENYVNHMWQLYEAGNKEVKPDGCSYNTLINAVSKSQNEGKAQKALRILRRMDKLYQAGYKYTRPNAFTYTSVLNSCAFSFDGDQRARRKALATAIFTLKELQESHYGSPNHVTYGTFLKACANLIPIDDEMRRTIIEPVFLQCCRDGQVGDLVLRQLRDAAPEDLYHKLLGSVKKSRSNIKIQDLPVEWRCNVRNKKRWQKREKIKR